MSTDEMFNKIAAHKQKQLELEAEWEKLRQDALQECLRLIDTFSFTGAELGFGKDGQAVKPVVKKVGAPKFQNPDGPETWTGRGKRPGWYLKAKEAGFTDEDLLIPPPAADPVEPPSSN